MLLLDDRGARSWNMKDEVMGEKRGLKGLKCVVLEIQRLFKVIVELPS
jgi:hypothetical protein